MQSLADVHTQPFVLIDADLLLRLVNRAFEDAYGVDREDAVGQPCYQLLHAGGPRPCPCGPDGAHCPFQAVFTGAKDQVSVHTYEGELGDERLVRIQGHPVQTESGEILLGELIQEDEPAGAEVDEADAGPRMVGDSGLFRQILGRLRLAARSAAPILLEGATGTGKELAADYIHRHSPRAQGPFVTLDCTTLGEDLFESEVFGHERGAFTGSVSERQGLFERAHGGTLFLDEIGEMPLALQAKLLRALESGEFRRVGSDQTRRADVRIVCATNRNLRDHPGFRQDLYFRIACVRVRMPALAERTEDIPALADLFLDRFRKETNKPLLGIQPNAMKLLEAYEWPGNVRELENAIERAVVLAKGRYLTRDDFAFLFRSPGQVVPQSMKEMEKQHIERILKLCQGNISKAADLLEVNRVTLHSKIKKYGLRP